MRNKSYVIVPDEKGDPCPRCGQPTQVREHKAITEKHLAQPFYYTRWFNCTNDDCQTTLIMPEHYKVWRDVSADSTRDERQLVRVQFATADEEEVFWRKWRVNKEFMRGQGYRVSKAGGQWIVQCAL
jgi:hypothetical protein